jgi:hypothetical protein
MTTKACKSCCEQIQLGAKRCPHCNQQQSRVINFLNMGGGALIGVAVLAFFFYQFHRNNQELKDYASKLSTGPFTVHVQSTSETPYASCLAIARNDAPFGWRNLQVEARFFDASGNLIDVTHQRLNGSFIPANGEAGVRVLERAARSASEYSRCELRFIDAESR